MVLIRQRTDDDIAPLCAIVREVHENDLYPVLLQDDVESFLVTSNCYDAWVVESEGSVRSREPAHGVVRRCGGAGERCPWLRSLRAWGRVEALRVT